VKIDVRSKRSNYFQKVFKLKPSDEKLLRGYVYDQELLGTANKDLMDALYDELGIPEVALAVKDKVDVSRSNAFPSTGVRD
jgi:hypothetical protein